MTREIKWSQWTPNGMIRCGFRDYNTLMKWMREIGKDAKNCMKYHENQHAIYGRKIYNEEDELAEIRFYCDSYMTDKELDDFLMENPRDVIYMVHRQGGLG